MSRISLPVILNEPLGALQKYGEMMKNVQLLEKAAKTPGLNDG